ncbi:MAG: hypothetical protein M1297_10310 [Nitrospirae bacterium]|nr:hypothetical protein [Nitrospirota bacterium]
MNLSSRQRVVSKERPAKTDFLLRLLSEVDFRVKVQRRGKKDSISGYACRQFLGGILVLEEQDGPGWKTVAEEVRENDTKRAGMMESFQECQHCRTGKNKTIWCHDNVMFESYHDFRGKQVKNTCRDKSLVTG